MTTETSIVDLLIRTVVALGVVLAIVAVAYVIAKRRGTAGARVAAGGRGAGIARTGGIPRARRSPRRSTPAGIEVVGRVGLSRNSAAVAVRFGDRIVLVATGEGGATSTLADMSAAEWDEMHTVREPIHDVLGSPVEGTPRVNFLEALRQATARHG